MCSQVAGLVVCLLIFWVFLYLSLCLEADSSESVTPWLCQ